MTFECGWFVNINILQVKFLTRRVQDDVLKKTDIFILAILFFALWMQGKIIEKVSPEVDIICLDVSYIKGLIW